MPTTLSPQQEKKFQRWYGEHADRLGINKNPDDPNHFYDYRGAFINNANPGPDGHWDSRYKQQGHPRMILDGINTKTGEKVSE